MDTSTTQGAGSLPTGHWAVVPRSSTAGFAVRNFGMHTVRGVVPIRSATVVCEGDGPDGRVTAVRASLDLAAIDTANTRRDKDLRGSRLLDTDRYPELTFDCTEVQQTADGWQLAGTLTGHGRSTPVTVDAIRTAGPVNGLLTVRASTVFDRRDLGITAPR